MAAATDTPVMSQVPVHHSFVGNRPLEGRGGRRPALNPATGAILAETSLLDAEQCSQAIACAAAAFPAWSALSFQERGRYLLKVRDAIAEAAEEIAELIAREQGKPVGEAHVVEILPALEGLRHLALHAEDLLADDAVEAEVVLFSHKEARLVYAPLGVVLAITPWNYPFAISVSSLASPLMAGNTVVLKPAPSTTVIGLRLGEVFRQAGLPEGVVNVVACEDTLAPGLVEDPRVAKVVFTGSVGTGRRVMQSAAKNLTPVLLELGGKDPAVVCRDADLDRAAQGIVWGAFLNSGQTCASVERVYVEEPVAEAFVQKVVEQTKKLAQGDPLTPGVDLGPMAMERQRRIVADHVQDALARGAKALTGGVEPPGPGFFYPPTVLTGVDHSMKVMCEETFGPVLPIMAVPSLEEAIRLANDSEYGLTASGWTRSSATAARLQRELRAGVVTINDCVYSYGEPTAPWGGLKHSGIGRIHGVHGLREMVQVKYVSTDDSRGPAVWWFPYDQEYRKVASASNQALHGRSVWRRVLAGLQLFLVSRFRRRVRLLDLLANADRLF